MIHLSASKLLKLFLLLLCTAECLLYTDTLCVCTLDADDSDYGLVNPRVTSPPALLPLTPVLVTYCKISAASSHQHSLHVTQTEDRRTKLRTPSHFTF